MKRATALLLLSLAGAQAAPVIFSDYRTQRPGVVHHITPADLPSPNLIQGVTANAPMGSTRPKGAWPTAPPGFKVTLYAENLKTPRELRTAPNGDVFLAESGAADVQVFRHGHPTVFASDLPHLYGMAFYPPTRPEWFYVSTPTDVYRYPYRPGDLHARGPRQHVITLPCNDRGHWTRDLAFSKDGEHLFVAVGSHSNVSSVAEDPQEKSRATVLEYRPDGTGMRVYVSGVRNAGAGLAVDPKSGDLWGSANERDGLGDDLPPDYVTHFEAGGFYGWPYYYTGHHPDPRHPDPPAARVLVPDVLIQPHNASLQLAFYQGTSFPAEYRGDIFCAQHGSWNRSVRTGYEVIRVPRHGTTRADGTYQDFLCGFVTAAGGVWGRPVGVTVAQDGALLVSDDMSGSIWRVAWVGSGK
ncbi:MAG TPA: PQQ-dependent sugar dehydrogenase [Candidatus Xenobia bacterium]|jgi:glucose/arabinose dehydrogenase